MRYLFAPNGRCPAGYRKNGESDRRAWPMDPYHVILVREPMNKKSILLFAGEASGDYHAAALVREIKKERPDIRVSGIGGDLLAQAGMELLHHYREVNTIGFGEGFGKLRQIWAAYKTMRNELLSGKHDLFIPVDFPDVNLRLCRFANKAKAPVYYFISPQVWAWRKGRIRKIAARVDRMMTIFPFEEKLYRSAGVRADFVGHTMMRDMPEIQDRETLPRSIRSAARRARGGSATRKSSCRGKENAAPNVRGRRNSSGGVS